MAIYETSQVSELTYRTLVWLTYRMAAIFAVGLPLILLLWASSNKQSSMIRLLTIYWKVSSLMAISMLLLTDNRPIGFITAFLSPVLMVGSIWFWVDLNEELSDLPPWRPLPLTVRIWRWAFTSFSLLASGITFKSLTCFKLPSGENCSAWFEAPKGLHQIFEGLFTFLFGGTWSEPVAAFVGYIALMGYVIGFLQWLLIRLPRQGRVAGEF